MTRRSTLPAVFFRNLHLAFLSLLLLVPFFKPQAQTVWNGPAITFTKADSADYTLAANQDRITPNIWITRAINKGLFNIRKEAAYTLPSPNDTEWSYGTLSNYATLTYTSWVDWYNKGPLSIIGKDAVVHLISENIYVGIKFLSWTELAFGGGFSYQRTTQQTLPVKLLSFSAKPQGQAMRLDWQTAHEQNSSHFEVESGTDGNGFTTIGEIKASGTSAVTQSYSFTDPTAAKGINYYRLKQVDLDGRFEYSKVISAESTLKGNKVSISPNPAADFINVRSSEPGAMQVNVLTTIGNLVKQQKFLTNAGKLNLQLLPPATYIIQVVTATGTYPQSIIKH